ncbi:hypothetical protein KUV85_13005 [Nocardioides panacisoli]|uniref:hypothetical protein n=1 Tax=Nocardioides panacisoli TaxID=627624 RepID=UPI001C632942|nr:hypothetical protein [Nocardioides panacisoli]QYJ03249.1 hypothetical protein KUV85_13005 [Nocardioides panacisoli]
MRSRLLRSTVLAVVLLGLAACSEQAEPFYAPSGDEPPVLTAYDPALEPSAAVLPLVPLDARRLEVTDFDQLRLTLGFGELDGSSPQGDRDRFWRRLPRTAALTEGLLRPFEDRLRENFSLGQDDVAWEASYSDGAQGWVLAFHGDLPSARIRRAIQAGVGPLQGATLDAKHNLVTSGEVPDAESSWGSDSAAVLLGGREANASYLERGCVPLEDLYGDDIVDRLEGKAERDVASLDELDHYAVHLGRELATVRLGDEREDAFTRLRLASHLPQLDPEFGRVFDGGVASPLDGELGYRMTRPARAASWVEDRTLPFAACET